MFPRLFTIDGFTLHSYGLLVATGLLVGIYTASRFADRVGGRVDRETVWNLGVYMSLAGLLGSKVFMILSDWGYYEHHPREIFSWSVLNAGGVWQGGLLFGLATGYWYVHHYHLPFSGFDDAYAPGLAVGHGLGRLGCFAAGCCWGKPTNLPWGVTFTDPYSARIVGTPLGVPLHPTQLYEALAEFLIFAWLLVLWRRRTFPGEVFAHYMMLYAVARFLIEFYRNDPRGPFLFGGTLSIAQAISVPIFLAAGLYWLVRRRQHLAAAHGR